MTATHLARTQSWSNRFTNGVDLNIGALGINLSTSTGFNRNTKIGSTFQNAGQLCGSDTTWPYAARVVGE